MRNNIGFKKAKNNKNDEFYTQLIDIEKELKNYKSKFKDKIIYCNCDDPLVSNFYKYFVDNFEKLSIKKVISSCYKENTKGYYYIYNGKNKKYPNADDVIYFKEDGDFRSNECIKLLKETDIVITNPPFSLFREHLKQIIDYNKDFLLIANINAMTYKYVYELILDNKIWLGINMGRGISGFIVPDHYELYGTEARINDNGDRIVSTNNALWLTNLDNFKRHEFLELNKTYKGSEENYPKYDNFNGIHVDKVKNIPKDYNGAMGVPITFLNKYNPEQFEIIKFRKGDDGKDLKYNGEYPYVRVLIKKK